MKKDPNVNVLQQPGLNIGYLAFNVEKKPFDNEARCARRSTWRSTRRRSSTPSTRAPARRRRTRSRRRSGRYNDDGQGLSVRSGEGQGAAREGRRDRTALEIDLWAMPVQRPYNPNAKRMAELMQADLAKVGVKAKIITYEWGEYRKRMQAGEHQTAHARLDRRQRRSGQLLRSCSAATRRKGGGKLSQVVQQDVRGPAHEGRARSPTRPSAPSSTSRRR